MAHYYTNNSDLPSQQINIEYTFKGRLLKITSDLGVFSKERVDFGTNVLLNSLQIKEEQEKVLDIGCGYGIIGLSIAKAYPNKKIVLIDINDRAIELAKKNIINNNINNASVLNKNILDGLENKYDLIVSNPPIRAGKNVVFGIVNEASKAMNENGELWLVIQKKQGAPSLMVEMENKFGNVFVINKDKGYYILKSIKKTNHE